jgi:hypothetical protein
MVMVCKRRIIVDMVGLLVGAIAQPAIVQDRDEAPQQTIRHAYRWLRHLFIDSFHAGGTPKAAVVNLGKWIVQIVRRCDAAKGGWLVGRTLARLNRNRRLTNNFEAILQSTVTWLNIVNVETHVAASRRSTSPAYHFVAPFPRRPAWSDS